MAPLVALPARYSDTAEGWRVPTFACGRTYQESIARAGGVPVMLAPIASTIAQLRDTLARFDAVCLPGGGDIEPERYGAPERHEKLYGMRAEHDEFELAVLQAALDLDLPTLAICRGFQVLNVARGGTLHQHITDDESSVKHRFELHEVSIEPGSRTAVAVGATTALGHSVHHQAVDVVGDGLVITATASDGVVEGLELADHRWVVGVQWHPEDTAHEDSEQQRLFDALIKQASAGR